MVIKKEKNKFFEKLLNNSVFNFFIVMSWILFIFFLIPFSPQRRIVGEGTLILNITGQILIILGFLLFIWLFLKKRGLGAQEMNKLLTTGAYGLSRHPIYLGHMLIFYGLILELGAYDALIISPLIVLIYLVTARIEEIYSIGKIFKEQYKQYRKRVPMYLKWWIVLILCIVLTFYITISFHLGFLQILNPS